MKRGYVKMLSFMLSSALTFCACTQTGQITNDSATSSNASTESLTFTSETGWGDVIKGAGTIDEATPYSQDLADNLMLQTAYEGAVLLKNDNEALPLTSKDKVAIFGSSQLWKATYARFGYRIMGAGAGAIYETPRGGSPIERLREKANEGKFQLYNDISILYENAYYTGDTYARARDNALFFPSDDEINKAKAAGVNKVIYIISRLEGEAGTEESALEPCLDSPDNTADKPVPDTAPVKGEYYLSKTEEKQLEILNKNFDQVIVVTNTGNILDTSWAKRGIDYGRGYEKAADSVLCAWYGGIWAFQSLADLLVGDAYPSGKLAQTAAKDIYDHPSTTTFFKTDFTDYTEDIFVGYRYFETLDPSYSKVNYEFGFGLSYTEFEISNASFKSDSSHIEVTATVKNIGKRNGKEVIQLYFSAPQKGTNGAKLSKSAKELAGFIKTKELAPNESQTVTVRFPIKDMASYDDTGITGAKSAYVLEAGDYTILVGNSIKNVENIGSYKVPEFTIVEQLTSQLAPYDLYTRIDYTGKTELLMPREREERTLNKFDESVLNGTEKTEFYYDGDEPKVYENGVITYNDVKNKNNTVEELVSQMTISELASFAISHYRVNSAGWGSGVGGSEEVVEKYGIPLGATCDGPACCGTYRKILGMPSETTIASSFNLDLAADFGTLLGKLSDEDGFYYYWLAPGINIKRNPLSGRNYEYFSEDPLVTGLFGSVITENVQKYGVGVSLKHFAANNKETNRNGNDSRVSERALREIYLKGFEIAVKETSPVSIMTAYNLLNGYECAENYELLIGIARNEWGFDGMYMTDWNKTPSLIYMLLGGNNTNQNTPTEMWDSDVLIEEYIAKNITRDLLEENAIYVINSLLKMKVEVEDADIYFLGYRHTLSETEVTYVEAEHCNTRHKGVTEETKYSTASGGSCLGYFSQPDEKGANQGYSTYKLVVTSDTTYDVKLTLSAFTPASVQIYVDGEPTNLKAENCVTGDWANFSTYSLGKIKLSEGTHVFKIVPLDNMFNPDFLTFTPTL